VPDILSSVDAARVCTYYYTDHESRNARSDLRGGGRADGLTTVILLDVCPAAGRAASSSDVASAPDRRHDTLCPYRASTIVHRLSQGLTYISF
jgi:hypothetical protein